MIQAAQVASKFTLFTHHAKTFPNLITALRNSMLRTGTFTNEVVAEAQVVSVINFDIHLIKDFRGRRYIERVTECIPVVEKNDYDFNGRSQPTTDGKLGTLVENSTKYFSRVTNRELYHYVNILEYQDGKYVLTNPISDVNLEEMCINMDDADSVRFRQFCQEKWGITLSDRGKVLNKTKVQ
jgi:pilus assembly protein CpaF